MESKLETQNMIMVKAMSHRAYQKLFKICDEKPQSYYLKDFSKHGDDKGFYLIPIEKLEEALKIKGITRTRNQNLNDYGMCWLMK